MKILFTYENPLPNTQADAEVFVSTAKHLAPLSGQCWLHVPIPRADRQTAQDLAAMPAVRVWTPIRPGLLRHFLCGLTVVLRKEFRQADLVYTRNLWVAWMSLMFGQRVAFDHYRPWPDQIPPMQFWLHRLMGNRRFLINICHSDYTRRKYLELGVPPEKLHCVHNGFEPQRFAERLTVETAKRELGIDPERKMVVYTGRVNHKKGLELVIEAAKKLPDIQFLFVGSSGEGPIERLAQDVPNIRMVPWQTPEVLGLYIQAADMLLIPPSQLPMTEFGSTVLPLKLFLYLGAGRPILAGDIADVREVLRHGENAMLCPPDSIEALVEAIRTIAGDGELAARLAAAALADSARLTWEARAQKIAALVANRMRSAPVAAGFWSGSQFRSWLRQSRRWLVHLLRNRSLFLPAAAAPSFPAESE